MTDLSRDRLARLREAAEKARDAHGRVSEQMEAGGDLRLLCTPETILALLAQAQRDAEEVARLRADVGALEKENFELRQAEKQWNESALMKSNLQWFEEAKKAHADAAALVAQRDTPSIDELGRALERVWVKWFGISPSPEMVDAKIKFCREAASTLVSTGRL